MASRPPALARVEYSSTRSPWSRPLTRRCCRCCSALSAVRSARSGSAPLSVDSIASEIGSDNCKRVRKLRAAPVCPYRSHATTNGSAYRWNIAVRSTVNGYRYAPVSLWTPQRALPARPHLGRSSLGTLSTHIGCSNSTSGAPAARPHGPDGALGGCADDRRAHRRWHQGTQRIGSCTTTSSSREAGGCSGIHGAGHCSTLQGSRCALRALYLAAIMWCGVRE